MPTPRSEDEGKKGQADQNQAAALAVASGEAQQASTSAPQNAMAVTELEGLLQELDAPEEVEPIDPLKALRKIKKTLPQTVTQSAPNTRNEKRIQKKLNKILKEVKDRREVAHKSRSHITNTFATSQAKREHIITKKQLVRITNLFILCSFRLIRWSSTTNLIRTKI